MLTGGGTGGHVTPAIALANELRRREPDAEFLYVGARAGKEAELVPRYGFRLVCVQSHQWAFQRRWHVFRFAWRLLLGVLKSAYLLLRFKPDAVIGTGGYVAAPVVFANVLLRWSGLSRARTIIHEQNMTPGRLNAFVGNAADIVLSSFSATAKHFSRVLCVGYPVRSEIVPSDLVAAKQRLGISEGTQVVLVFGGSMGARTINRAIIDALPFLRDRKHLRIIHGTGRRLSDYDPVRDCAERRERLGLDVTEFADFYEAHEFIDQIGDYYAAADLVVCRSGAGTLAELCACGRPALLIPKANLPGDHQVLNALEMFRHGAADVLYEDVAAREGKPQEFVNGGDLACRIMALLDDEGKRSEMATNALLLARTRALPATVDAIQMLVETHSSERVLASSSVEVDLSPAGKNAEEFEALAGLAGEALKDRADRIVAQIEQETIAAGETPVERAQVILDAMDADEIVSYLRYRAATHLASPSWRMANAGVKMVGILRQQGKLSILTALVRAREPAPILKRLIGGDFTVNGFLRRNAMASIARLGVYSAEVRMAILDGLADPYFEVRAQSARTAQAFHAQIGEDDEIMAAAARCCADGYFEVVAEAIKALGCLGSAPVALPMLREAAFCQNWRIRQAVVESYCTLMDRGIRVDRSSLRDLLSDMMVTSTGFTPTFALKSAVHRLGERLHSLDASDDTHRGR
jgi:UDP-N-acetylglucosamine--N-acetylmuramyl-(pentapeptide) pyrophosphoryl-undecaprenol N-acetylglucosamine transferase